jgi:hypothetical protein
MAGDSSRFGSVQAEVVGQLRASAGVSGVTVSADAPMEEPQPGIEVDGSSTRSDVSVNHVDEAFFRLFDVPLLAGRGFEATDFVPRAPGQTAVIVNRSFVEELADEAVSDWNPIGRRVRYSGVNDPSRWYEIVGVVDDVMTNNDRPTVYHALVPGQIHPISLTVRVGPNTALVAGRLREIVGALDPALRVDRLRSLAEIYRQQGSTIRMFGLVLASAMLIVLLFSMAGIYTLMAFTLAQRWREIGLRSALGAQPRRLVAEIFGRALLPVGVGAVAGSLIAFLMDSYVRTDQVGGQDIPGIIPASAAILIAVGLLAAAGPARRAIRINPTEALRDG